MPAPQKGLLYKTLASKSSDW